MINIKNEDYDECIECGCTNLNINSDMCSNCLEGIYDSIQWCYNCEENVQVDAETNTCTVCDTIIE